MSELYNVMSVYEEETSTLPARYVVSVLNDSGQWTKVCEIPATKMPMTIEDFSKRAIEIQESFLGENERRSHMLRLMIETLSSLGYEQGLNEMLNKGAS